MQTKNITSMNLSFIHMYILSHLVLILYFYDINLYNSMLLYFIIYDIVITTNKQELNAILSIFEIVFNKNKYFTSIYKKKKY